MSSSSDSSAIHVEDVALLFGFDVDPIHLAFYEVTVEATPVAVLDALFVEQLP